MVGDAGIALVGEVDLGPGEVVGDALEATELAPCHRPQARRDLDVVTPNDQVHARPLVGVRPRGGPVAGV